MAFTPHLLISFGGSWIDEPGEVWECTLRARPQTDGEAPEDFALDDYLAYVEGNLATFWASASNKMMIKASLEFLKINPVGADGRYILPTTHVYDYSPVIQGGVVANGLPGYCSLAWTWETGRNRGRAHRGRMYPPNVVPLTSAMRVSDGNAADMAVTGQHLLTILDGGGSGIASQEVIPGVYSRIDGSHYDITGVSCDTIYDVQRRRKNRVTGDRQGPVPYAHP